MNDWWDYTGVGELYHHGIEGQKWGVRNGPPYPIDHTVMKAGTKLGTVVSGISKWEDLETILKDKGMYRGVDDTVRKMLGMGAKRWLYTYNPDDKWDKKVYEGPFSYYLAAYRGAYAVNALEMQTVKDLKMPTKKERVDEFINMYNSKKGMVVKDLIAVQKVLVKQGLSEYANFDLKKLKTESDLNKAYEIFNHAMENVEGFKSTKEYANRMSTKYDAMVDDNNQGIYNDTHDPVIIFNRDAVEFVSARSLDSANDIIKNTKEIKAEMEKKGKQLRL